MSLLCAESIMNLLANFVLGKKGKLIEDLM